MGAVARWTAAGALCLALGPFLPQGCAPEAPQPEPDASAVPASVTSRAAAFGYLGVIRLAGSALDAHDQVYGAYVSYVDGRVVELSRVIRPTQYFGPWEAVIDHEAVEADPNGGIIQWDNGYYVTHDWSVYGQQILTMMPGDIVTINGLAVQVVDIYDYPKEAYLSEVLVKAGEDSVVFQTCEPGHDLNRIVVCR